MHHEVAAHPDGAVWAATLNIKEAILYDCCIHD